MGIGQLFSCIWISVSVIGLVVVSVLEVDRMGVVGREVVMVNFVSNGGQVELFSEAEVEEDLAGTWHHQGEQEVVGTGYMLLLPSIMIGRMELGVNILFWVQVEEVILLVEVVRLVGQELGIKG